MTDPTNRSWKDHHQIRIQADIEQVWAAWTEPEHVRRWFSDDAHGTLEPGAELVHVFEGHGEHRYQVLEVEAPKRLLLEGRMMGGGPFRQEVILRSEGGTTILELVHSGFGDSEPEDEIAKGIDSGWSMALAVLKHYVERYFGKEKIAIPVFRPAAFEYDALARSRYFGPAAREDWLQTDPPVGGDELVRTEHEVCLEWPAVRGVLELKAYGSGPGQRVLGLRAVAWGVPEDEVPRLAGQLEAAVESLMRTL